jgi:hypothetical protein
VRWLVGLALLLLCAGAAAEASRVVLLEPTNQAAALREAFERTKAELGAAGFDVVVRPLVDASNPRPALEEAARETNAFAAVAISTASGSAAADIWVTDRLTGKTLIRSVDVRDVGAESRASALAIRAVELLRASLVEAIHPPPPPATVPAPAPAPIPDDVSEWMADPVDSPLAGFALEIGGALLHGFDDLGPAGSPLLRLSYGADLGLAGRLTVAGPAFGARPEGPYGSAVVRQEMATLELVYAPPVDWWGVQPLASAGFGAYHLHARGELEPPFVGQTDEVWSLAVRFGVGLGYRFHPDVMALLDAELVLVVPRAVVTMAGEPIASAGAPSLSSSLGVVVRFP